MATLLVVDDDPALLRALRLGLRSAGFAVRGAATGAEALEALASETPDAVILDLGLPDIDGVEVCRRIRAWSEVPVIVLSATDAETRKVAALDLGADDYVTKPFGMAELEARVRAALRRRQGSTGGSPSGAVVTAGALRVDLGRRSAAVDGADVGLTGREWDVLAFLAAHAGHVCPHDRLLAGVWGAAYGVEASYVHAYVHRLRAKLGPAAGRLRTVPGIGYVLDPDPPGG